MDSAREQAPGEIVLDGSVALAWYFTDEADAYANAVARCLPRTRAVVPAIWPLEVANAPGVADLALLDTDVLSFFFNQDVVRVPRYQAHVRGASSTVPSFPSPRCVSAPDSPLGLRPAHRTREVPAALHRDRVGSGHRRCLGAD